jgi:hypothetical protein
MPNHAFKSSRKENGPFNRAGSIGPARRKTVCVEPAPVPLPKLAATMPLDFSADLFNSTVAKGPTRAEPVAAPPPTAAAAAEPKQPPVTQKAALSQSTAAGGKTQKGPTSMSRKRHNPLDTSKRPVPNYLRPTAAATAAARSKAQAAGAPALSAAESAAARRAAGAAARESAKAAPIPKPMGRVTRSRAKQDAAPPAEEPPKPVVDSSVMVTAAPPAPPPEVATGVLIDFGDIPVPTAPVASLASKRELEQLDGVFAQPPADLSVSSSNLSVSQLVNKFEAPRQAPSEQSAAPHAPPAEKLRAAKRVVLSPPKAFDPAAAASPECPFSRPAGRAARAARTPGAAADLISFTPHAKASRQAAAAAAAGEGDANGGEGAAEAGEASPAVRSSRGDRRATPTLPPMLRMLAQALALALA